MGSETLTALVGVRLVLGAIAEDSLLLESSSEEGSLMFSLVQNPEEGVLPAEAGLTDFSSSS